MGIHAFTKLLEVRIWHDYLLFAEKLPPDIPSRYDVTELVNIVPSEKTKTILESYNLLFRPTSTGFVVLAKTIGEEPAQTFTIFDEPVKLSFLIQGKHPAFPVMTNLPLQGFTKNLLYFNNLQSNVLNIENKVVHYISTPLPGYEPGFKYQMSDLIRHGNKVYEVIDIPVENPPESAPWAMGKNTQYVSKADRVLIGTGMFDYEGANQNPGEEVIFTIRNSFGEGVFEEKTTSPEDPEEKVAHKLRFRGKAEEIYSIFKDEALVGRVYFLDPKMFSPPLGVIELFHTPGGPNMPVIQSGYRYIDTGQDPQAPLSIPTGRVYHIHFKSRMTFWRYVSKEGEKTLDKPRSFSMTFSGVLDENNKKLPDPDLSGIEIEKQEIDDMVKEKYISKIYI
ncbi:MAG: hypothetical protein R3B93_08040 [Bacteroidia bacterium]